MTDVDRAKAGAALDLTNVILSKMEIAHLDAEGGAYLALEIYEILLDALGDGWRIERPPEPPELATFEPRRSRPMPRCQIQAVCVRGRECLDAGHCLAVPEGVPGDLDVH